MTGPGTSARQRSRPSLSSGVLDLVGLGVRLVLAGVMLYAGWAKLTDLTGSVQNVLAYELVGYDAARVIGVLLPVVEVALGVLLLVGLLTRGAAAVTGLLLLVFVAGIVSAWVRGLAIDCGCFGTGGGGSVAPEDTRYLTDLLRDAVFLALVGWLVVRPHTPWSVDRTLTKGR